MPDHTPVVTRMLNLVEIWEQNADRRAIFLSCYAQMTQNMLLAIERGEFHDPAWVGNLVVHFADYYFDALDAYQSGLSPTPRPWVAALDATREPKVHVMQHLLLGINAHINYDLCFAIEDALRPEWAALNSLKLEQRHADHCHINLVIARTIDAVQDTVIERYSPLMDFADRLLGRLDEKIITQMIRSWRGEVWDHALRLAEASPEARAEYSQVIESQAVERAHRLLDFNLIWLLEDLL